MQMVFGKGRQLFIIVLLVLALLVYATFLTQLFGRRAKLMLVAFIVFVVLTILLTGPSFRTYLMFVISLPLTHTLVIDIGFTVTLTYLLLLLLIFMMLVSREFWYSKTPLDTAILVFLGICTLSIIQTVLAPPPRVEFTGAMKYRGTWFRSLIQLALLYFFSLGYFFTTHVCGNNRKRLDITLKTYIVVAIIISIYGIYQGFASHFDLPLKNVTNAMRTSGMGYGGLFTHSSFSRYRAQGTIGEPLGFGHYLLTVIPFLLAFAGVAKGYIDLEGRKWMTGTRLALVIVLIFVTLFMTRSRGSLFGFACAIMLASMLLRSRNLPRFLGYLFVCGLVLTVFYIAAVRFLGVGGDPLEVLRFRRILEVTDIQEDALQMTALETALSKQRYSFFFYFIPKLLSQHPILGVGIGNYSLHAASFLGSSVIISPAGVWGTVLVETGFLGFIAFSWMVFSYCRIMIRTLAKVRGTYWSAYIIGQLSCFVGLMVQHIFSMARMPVYVWFHIGISMATVRLINQEIQQADARSAVAGNERIPIEGSSSNFNYARGRS